MLFAGHETTALAMTYALHQIGTHREVAERFYTEIDSVLDEEITLAELQELEYLEQIINESLRLYPPIHAIPRVTTRRVDIGDYTLPADAEVLLSVWSLHRDERFYNDPLSFDPDRWDETTPRTQGYSFVPFGGGPRICIGRHFARLEMKAVLATIGQKFRLDAEDEISVTPRMTTQPDGAVPIEVHKRP